MLFGFGGLGWVSTWANACEANATTEIVISSAASGLFATAMFSSPSID
jgi:hypothetical protein